MPATTLETLCWDVFYQIIQDLDCQSLIFLSATSRAFYTSLDPSTLASEASKRKFYLRAERFPQNAGRLSCFICWRLLPKSAFSISHTPGNYGKYSTEPHLDGMRFCWDCGARHRLFPDLKPVMKADMVWHYLCHRCGEFKTSIVQCEPSQCSPPLKLPTRTPFQRLPEKVLGRIVGHLPYEDALRLAQTSKHFRKAVRPVEDTSLRSRYLFVRSKERISPPKFGTWGPQRCYWGCYACFTCRDTRSFGGWSDSGFCSADWARRCVACVQKHSDGTAVGLAGLERWRRQTLCRQWHVLKYEDKECETCALSLVREGEGRTGN